MKVVLVEQFHPTEGEHVWVDLATLKLGAKPICPSLSFLNSGGLGDTTKLPGVEEMPASESEELIHVSPSVVKLARPVDETPWRQECLDKLHREVACPGDVLGVGESIVDPLPFGGPCASNRLNQTDIA